MGVCQINTYSERMTSFKGETKCSTLKLIQGPATTADLFKSTTSTSVESNDTNGDFSDTSLSQPLGTALGLPKKRREMDVCSPSGNTTNGRGRIDPSATPFIPYPMLVKESQVSAFFTKKKGRKERNRNFKWDTKGKMSVVTG